MSPPPDCVTRARILSQAPAYVSIHWDAVAGRNVPHLDRDCPYCARHPQVGTRGAGYVAAAIHQRQRLDAVVSSHQRWDDHVCLCLPDSLVEQLCLAPEIGHQWRGLIVDVWHATQSKRSALRLAVLERADTAGWPAAWDVYRDLDRTWAEYLSGARLVHPWTSDDESEVG